MSVASRLLNRRFTVLAVAGQDGGKELPGFHGLRARLLSTPSKTAAEENAGKSEPPKSEPPVSGTQKTQTASTPPQKPPTPRSTPQSTPQSTPAPGQKPQIPQTTRVGAPPGTQPKPVQKVHPGQPQPAGSKLVPPTQKLVPPGQARPAVKVGQGAAGTVGQKTLAGQGGGPVSKPRQSRLKVFLASGVVGGLVLGLLYWQSPKLHNGSAIIGGRGKGKDDATGAQPSEEEKRPEEHVAEIEIPQSSGDETVLKVVLEPEAVVKVEASTLDPAAAKQENRSSSSDTGHADVESRTEEVLTRIEPDAGSTLEKIVIEFEPLQKEETRQADERREESQREEARQADESVVNVIHEPAEFSESYLLQRGHENAVKEHDQASEDKVSGLNIVAAIHAAEQKQAEIDAAVYREKLHLLEEKHHHELENVERKASGYHEQILRLQQGMEAERQKQNESLKLQHDQAEASFQEKAKLMKEATQRLLEEAELLAKAEAANALIQERVSFLSDIGSVKVHMEAMNIALDAKSEEAREGHEIKQLSVGSFAFEDALLTGAPVDKEAAVLLKSTGGDPLVEVAVKSLPKEVLESGTLTPAQLDRNLEEMEGTLRELALIPASGGGVLCHLIARLATLLKLPDHGKHEDWGVDAVLSQVQEYIREGELLDAADAMSRGLSGTNAEKLAQEWAAQARNRAVLEQACALLRAHAAALALGDYSS